MISDLAEGMRIAVFASGGGTNYQAILDAIQRRELPASPVICVSNRADAGALERARRHAIATHVLSSSGANADEVAAEMLETLHQANANFIALAGFLKMIPERVISAYRNRIVNIHPSLLPAFGGRGMYGRRVHEAVIEHGVRWTGVTVHVVDEHYDTGPIVLQEPVPVLQDDTPESVASRVLEAEHRLYPEALRLFAQGRISIEGRHVRILDSNPNRYHERSS